MSVDIGVNGLINNLERNNYRTQIVRGIGIIVTSSNGNNFMLLKNAGSVELFFDGNKLETFHNPDSNEIWEYFRDNIA